MSRGDIRPKLRVPKGSNYGDPVCTKNGPRNHYEINVSKQYARCVRCQVRRSGDPNALYYLFEEGSLNCMKCTEAKQVCTFLDPVTQVIDKKWYEVVCQRLASLEGAMGNILADRLGYEHNPSNRCHARHHIFRQEDICVTNIDKQTVDGKLTAMEAEMHSHPLFDSNHPKGPKGNMHGRARERIAIHLMKKTNCRLEKLERSFSLANPRHSIPLQGPPAVPVVSDSPPSTLARQLPPDYGHTPAETGQLPESSSESDASAQTE